MRPVIDSGVEVGRLEVLPLVETRSRLDVGHVCFLGRRIDAIVVACDSTVVCRLATISSSRAKLIVGGNILRRISGHGVGEQRRQR